MAGASKEKATDLCGSLSMC